MTHQEELEMHQIAQHLANITAEVGWEATRYRAVAQLIDQLCEYCAPCSCIAAKNKAGKETR